MSRDVVTVQSSEVSALASELARAYERMATFYRDQMKFTDLDATAQAVASPPRMPAWRHPGADLYAIPPKPAGMRQATYRRIVDDFRRGLDRQAEDYRADLERLTLGE